MMVGDERYMPHGIAEPSIRAQLRRCSLHHRRILHLHRHRGPALGFVQNPAIQSFVSLAFFAVTALIVIDTAILLIQMNIRAKKEFPDKSDRRGLMLYAVMRTLQLRRLRLPPPMVTRGGKPIKRGADGKPIKDA